MIDGSIYSQFEILCEFLLISSGFEIVESSRLQKAGSGMRVRRPDFVVVKRGSSERVAVDVKFYRSSAIGGTTIANAIAALDGTMISSDCTKGLFIAPIKIAPHFPVPDTVDIWDTEKLLSVADEAGCIPLLEKFLDRRRFRTDHDQDLYQATQILLAMIDQYSRRGPEPIIVNFDAGIEFEEALRKHGHAIIAALENCPAGKGGAKAFEDVCFDALKYLFDEEFEAWKTQNRVEGGFHINDVVARMTPVHDFWKWLSHDFSSRYVVFEFKNYTDAISQGQIYSTEKYLYSGALRKIAIIVARNGCDQGAVRSIKAALREHGKLIVWVTRDELKEMIELKDRGEEFIGALSDRVDQLLTDLAP